MELLFAWMASAKSVMLIPRLSNSAKIISFGDIRLIFSLLIFFESFGTNSTYFSLRKRFSMLKRLITAKQFNEFLLCYYSTKLTENKSPKNMKLKYAV
jgi:hypothetical protein